MVTESVAAEVTVWMEGEGLDSAEAVGSADRVAALDNGGVLGVREVSVAEQAASVVTVSVDVTVSVSVWVRVLVEYSVTDSVTVRVSGSHGGTS
jgi:hypothetical protein